MKPSIKNRSCILLSFLIFLYACKNEKGPNVSGIEVVLQTERFEKDFFSLDTNDLSGSLDKLYRQYPLFFRDFTVNILGLSPVNDSGEQTLLAMKQFIRDYKPVYDSVNKVFPSLSHEEEEVIKALKYVKYYFPEYKLPVKLTSFIGPMDAIFQGSTASYGDAITSESLAVGLQLHLGNNFSMYQSEMGLSLYPAYISRKFTPAYIPVNSVKNIIDDLFPDQSSDKTLIEQMIEKGKRIYLTDQLMPWVNDTLKIGYTDAQLKGCYANEGPIWNYFIKNGLVYNNDPSMIKNYIGDSPNTPEFGEGAPGYIGLFIGWQIVKKYMDASDDAVGLKELMAADAKTIFEKSKYSPK